MREKEEDDRINLVIDIEALIIEKDKQLVVSTSKMAKKMRLAGGTLR